MMYTCDTGRVFCVPKHKEEPDMAATADPSVRKATTLTNNTDFAI